MIIDHDFDLYRKGKRNGKVAIFCCIEAIFLQPMKMIAHRAAVLQDMATIFLPTQ